jgi:hypothetical protein
MKKIILLICIIVCIMVAGCVTDTAKNTTPASTVSPTLTVTPANVPTTLPVSASGGVKGRLIVAIGEYNATLPVTVDNTGVGNVSLGKPLNITVNEGLRTVKVCSGNRCEQVQVEIKSAIKTTLDFEERLKNNAPQGSLSVSLGDYNANLPVFIDNASAGNVSTGKPLNVMLSEGNHTVRVCVGLVCENEVVTIKFAQQSIVDFGERLKKSAEFATPTVRIVNYFVTGNRLVVDAEFINPGKTDLSMTATIGVGYSYIDSSTHQRQNQYGQYRFTRSVKAGNRTKQSLEMTLSGGSSTVASEPKIVEVFTG